MSQNQSAASRQPVGGPIALSPWARSLGFELAWSGASRHAASPIAGGERVQLADAGGVTPATGAQPNMIGYAFSGSGTGQVTARVTETVENTFVVVYSNLTGGASFLGRLLSTYNGAGGHDLYCDGVSLILQEFFSGGTTVRTIGTAPGTGSTPIALAFSSTGTTNPTAYASVDGAAASVSASANASGTRVAGGTTLGIGGRPDTTGRQVGARVYFAARSRYALDQATLDKISANPWALIVVPRPARRLGVASGAATHTTTGDLSAQAATLSGAALHPHTTTGALSAQDATVSGAAVHPHTTTGALSAQAATVAGAATHPHTTTGALSAAEASVSGAAEHTSPATHDATGALSASAATIDGSAAHVTLHDATGDLAADAASLVAVAQNGTASTLRGRVRRRIKRPMPGLEDDKAQDDAPAEEKRSAMPSLLTDPNQILVQSGQAAEKVRKVYRTKRRLAIEAADDAAIDAAVMEFF